jgi:eukaryotic-like serine/threonine-protein kinase
MQYLSERGIAGMIPYREAAEIPACTVMEFVPGPNLKQAVESRQIDDWEAVLKISVALARILKAAHSIPERVLHRDVRPSNIMLKGFYERSGEWDVVLLDFDLAWHSQAIEVSVLSAHAATGYLAPEQVMRNAAFSTRSALVDSFGLGMTLCFLRSGTEPKFLEHRHEGWKSTLTNLSSIRCDNWKSLPKRFARLIENSTCDRQADRWDMSFILGELERLHQAFHHPSTVISAELLAEEITSRGDLSHVFRWDQDRVAGVAYLPSGIEVTVRGEESQRSIIVTLRWQNTGRHAVHRNVKKWHTSACDKASAILKEAGWIVKVRGNNPQLIDIDATLGTEAVSNKLDTAARAAHKAVKELDLT